MPEHNFDPQELEANVGDFIMFKMMPANHSVARMDPNSPCIPYDMINPESKPSYWTGFYPTQDARGIDITDNLYEIVDDKPAWFYCTAPGSCPEFQMVMVVNPERKGNDLIEVKAAASDADYSLSPGEEFPDDHAASDDSESDSSTSEDSSGSSSDGGSSLSAGAIAGIVIGAIGAFALVGLLFFFVGRKKKAAENSEKPASHLAGHPHDPENPTNLEHPPMYHDPRYSQQIGIPPPPASPRPWSEHNVKHGHASMMSEDFNPPPRMGDNPHRLSELPSQNYDPVEIYTPGLPEHHDVPSPIQEGNEADSPRDTRRDTVG